MRLVHPLSHAAPRYAFADQGGSWPRHSTVSHLKGLLTEGLYSPASFSFSMLEQVTTTNLEVLLMPNGVHLARCCKVLQRMLFVWLLLVCGIALYWESLGSPYGLQDPWLWLHGQINVFIVFTMLCVGVLLPHEELVALGRSTHAVIAGVMVQYTAMPLLAWLAGQLYPLSADQQLGVVLVGCVPGAMASNVLTFNARGHVGYSVCLTTLSTLVSPVAVPVAMLIALGKWQYHPVLLQSALYLATTVVVPVIVGYWISRKLPARWFRHVAALGANLAVLLIIASVVAKSRQHFFRLEWNLPLALLTINLAGYAAGWYAGSCLKISLPMRRALALEVGMQNAGLGAALAAHLFPSHSEVALAPALYSFGCMLTGTLLSQYWGWRGEL